jgi:hypothetical protein
MATKSDPAAAKARKQRIILIGAGALFLVLALIQGPKLWKQLNPPAPEAAAPASTDGTTAALAPTTTAAGTTAVATSPAPTTSGATTLTAVSVTARPPAGQGQLTSFTLFEVKDPFEQQVTADTGGSATTSGTGSGADSARTITGGGSGSARASGGTPDAQKEPAPTYATIQVNGKPSQVQAKDAFPQPEKLFVLVSLKKLSAKVGVKGGSFADGDLVVLTLGKAVTLMNTVTGTRYVVKLVYTGTQPENIEGFSKQPGAAPAPSSAGATTAETTTTSGSGAPSGKG